MLLNNYLLDHLLPKQRNVCMQEWKHKRPDWEGGDILYLCLKLMEGDFVNLDKMHMLKLLQQL